MSQAQVLEKPKLRGVSHEIAFYLSLCAILVLSLRTPTTRTLVATLVYGGCLAFLFGASALYHRPTWTPQARARMRRVDHAAIYLLIAGTITPFALSLDADSARQMLLVAWGGAAGGVLQCLFWPNAPKPVATVLYLMLGWSIVPFLSRIEAVAGVNALMLLAAGGLAYTVGAVVYAVRRPNPLPTWFGYHEIFHALVVVAASLHFVAISSLVLRG